MDIPETRYATTEDGVSIAYQTFGEGPVDLVVDPSTVGNIEILWEFDPIADLYRRLAGFSRLILHDRRGSGLSASGSRLPDLETRAQDLLCVLDACGAPRPALFGSTTGGAALAIFAVTYPERTLALAWYGPMARTSWAPDYPWGETPEQQEDSLEEAGTMWGSSAWDRKMLEANAPDFAGDERLLEALARMRRHFVAPSTAIELERTWNETDVTQALGALRCPVLLFDRPDAPFDFAEVEYVQTLIPGAEVARLPGTAFPMFLGDRASIAEAVRRFLGVDRVPVVPESVLATVLFTDIVGSTHRAAELGDAAWKDLLGAHDRVAREQIERFRGRFVHTTGDGLLATFDGPARSVRCAQAIVDAVGALGLDIRAGCHTGEIELAGDDVLGVTVHIGARVAALAGTGEVLVSSTVKHLTPGSGLVFEDAGEHELKGVPDRWHLYRVVR